MSPVTSSPLVASPPTAILTASVIAWMVSGDKGSALCTQCMWGSGQFRAMCPSLLLSWYDLPSLLHPPLAASDPIHLHSTPYASTLLQLQSILVQLMQLCHAHSRTNCGSILDLFGPGSHAKGHRLYTLSTFVLFAGSFFIDNNG